MSIDKILASADMRAGVGFLPTSDPCLDVNDYPIGAISTLSAVASISSFALGYLAFRFRRIWLAYVRDRIEYGLSTRTDLSFRLTYEMSVGGEQHSTVTIPLSNWKPETVALEMRATTTVDPATENELSEVVVCE